MGLADWAGRKKDVLFYRLANLFTDVPKLKDTVKEGNGWISL